MSSFAVSRINPCDLSVARSRLTSALQVVKTDSVNASVNTSDVKDAYEGTEDSSKDAKFQRYVPSLSKICKKRTKSIHKKVIFELRQKSFEIQNVYEQLTLYALCRTWLLGKSETAVKQDKCIQTTIKSEPEDTSESEGGGESTAVSQDIYQMPAAGSEPCDDVSDEVPKASVDEVGVPTAQNVLLSHMPHWRDVRKYWQKKSHLRSKRYDKSLSLLRTMFTFEVQNQLLIFCISLSLFCSCVMLK